MFEHGQGRLRGVGFVLVLALLAGCAAAPRSGTFARLTITGDEIREAGYDSAYEALTHHRHLIVFEDRIGFRGGDDRSGLGSDRQDYTVPLLVVDEDADLGDAVTTLRRIRAEDIVWIRLWRASMVPPEHRRPGAEGGVIEVRTR